MEITKDSTVQSVFENFPQTQEVFRKFGFHALFNPVLRNTMGRLTSIARGCKMHHVDPDQFLAALQTEIAKTGGKGAAVESETCQPQSCCCDSKTVAVSAEDRQDVDRIRQTNIADVVKQYPNVTQVFEKHFGPGCFSCPSFGMESVDFACAMHNTDPDRFALDCLKAIRKGCDCC